MVDNMRVLLLFMAIFCCTTQMKAQVLTGAEVDVKMNEAIELQKAKKTDKALALFLEVGKNTELQRTEYERLVYVFSQTMACMCYHTLKRYEEGYLLAKKLMQGRLLESEKKDVGVEYAYNGYMYAVDFITKESSSREEREYGREIFTEIAPYADEILQPYVVPNISYSWYVDGSRFFISAEYNKALLCFQKAYDGYMKINKLTDAVNTLKQMASCKRWLYDISGAVDIYNKALMLAEQTDNDMLKMELMKELWNIHNNMGNVQFAQIYAAKMDSLAETFPNDEMKYSYYNQKGNEAKSLGKYAIAEQWFLQGKNMAEKKSAENKISANRFLSYSNLQNLYVVTGQYDEALKYAEKAIEEFQKYTPPTDATYNMPYMSLADIYQLMGDEERCYASLEKVFENASRMTEPKELYSLYITRGRCNFTFKNWQAALEDYKMADKILASKYPQSDGDRVVLLALVGGVENKLGNYTEAEHLYKKYAQYAKTLYGDESLEYINAQVYMANAKGFAGNVSEGCKDYDVAVKQLKKVMRQRIPYMSITEREGYWQPLSSLFTMMSPYALKAGQYQTAFTQSCYDALVMSKSFLLESEKSMYDVVKREGTAADMQDYMQLTEMKNCVKKLEKESATYADSILDISRKVSSLESQLAKRCLNYCQGTEFMDIDYTSVKQALKQNETLIDFTDFVSETKGRRYAAFVINKTQKYPLLKSLFDERQMDSLEIVRPDMYYDADYASDVLRLLWEPLKEEVTEGTTVYYVPSQLLFLVSLESLPLADGSLLGSHYNFVRLSSARELVAKRNGNKKRQEHTAVLYGGLQYDLDATVMAEESKKYDLGNLFAKRGNIVRGDSVFHELNGAKEEVVKIESILKSGKWNVTSYVGKNGTEESFLNMHGKSPELLHLATHGFYYTPSNAEDVDYLKGYTDAMSLSGFVLSGGNAAWLGRKLPNGVLGGILTANDIARLDLSGTDMVVLSACQTGQGKATSEGLYGLQRAFKKAGVGTIVMSLWNVSDKTASDFMVTFYKRLADKANARNKRKAFEETKEIIRKKYSDPYHWAAFVMLD